MIIERIAVALGFDLPRDRKPVGRLIVFAVLGGVLLGAIVFVPIFVATAAIWPSAQRPVLAFTMGFLAFVTGTVVGALSAWQ
jgi:uncharacterized membrane protein